MIIKDMFGYILKNKNDALGLFKKWTLLLENQTLKRIKTLRVESGLDICAEIFTQFCKKNDIGRQLTVPKKLHWVSVCWFVQDYLLVFVQS